MRDSGTTNYFVPHDAIDEEKGRDSGLGGKYWIRSTIIAWAVIQAPGTICQLTSMNWTP